MVAFYTDRADEAGIIQGSDGTFVAIALARGIIKVISETPSGTQKAIADRCQCLLVDIQAGGIPAPGGAVVGDRRKA
jgi:hypothetical protein